MRKMRKKRRRVRKTAHKKVNKKKIGWRAAVDVPEHYDELPLLLGKLSSHSDQTAFGCLK